MRNVLISLAKKFSNVSHADLKLVLAKNCAAQCASCMHNMQGKDWNSQAKIGNGGFYGK